MAAALAPAVAAMPAPAQDVRGKQAGDMLRGAGLPGVLPANTGSTSIGGTPRASDTATPQLDLTYFLTPSFAATSRHDVQAHDTALGTVDLGRVWALPPTVTLQCHPLPGSRPSPHVGVGLNHTAFCGEGGRRNPVVTGVDVENAFGHAVNVGLDAEVTPNWLANVDVKRLWLGPAVSLRTTPGPVTAKANLYPWIIGARVRYRF